MIRLLKGELLKILTTRTLLAFAAAGGSMKGLQLVVSDAAARQELVGRGVEASEIQVINEADGGTFFGFADPDGNTWAVQEIKARAETPLIPEGHAGLGAWAGR